MKQTKYRILLIVLVILILGFVPQIIEFIYEKEGIEFTVTDFSKSELLLYYGSFLTFIGTVLLGAITLYQNYVFKKENEQSQQRFERINNKMMKAQQAHYIPVLNINIKDVYFNKDFITKVGFIQQSKPFKRHGINEICTFRGEWPPCSRSNYHILFDDKLVEESEKEIFDLLRYRLILKNIGTTTIRKVYLRNASIHSKNHKASGSVNGILLKEQFVSNGELEFWLSAIAENAELEYKSAEFIIITLTFLLLTLDDRVFIYQLRFFEKNGVIIDTDVSCSEALDEDERYNWIRRQRGF